MNHTTKGIQAETCKSCGSVLSYPYDPRAMEWIEAKVPTSLEGGSIPGFIIALPDERLLTQAFYAATGRALAAWGLPQRSYMVELALRIEWYRKAGGLYFDADLSPLDIDSDCFEQFMDRDPSCKVFCDWPRRAMRGEIKQAPKGHMLDLLRLVNLGLRTPPCGFAI